MRSICLETCNIVLQRFEGFDPGAGDSGDAAIMAAFEEVVLPAAERFQPDLILVCSL